MARIAHGTLTANTITTVTLDSYTSQVTIINRTRTGEIYFTVDGTDPSIYGTNSYPCLGARAVCTNIASTVTVKLVAGSAIDYSVIGETQ